MPYSYNRELIPRARELRKDLTPQEKKLWYCFLRTCSLRVQRQKTIGNFIVDFYCHQAKLVIEVDGGQHFVDDGIAYDTERTAYLNGLGLRVIRFSNQEIDCYFGRVCQNIQEHMNI